MMEKIEMGMGSPWALTKLHSAVDAIYTAYWALCDGQQGALDPANLAVPPQIVELLQEVFEAASRIEGMMQRDEMSWSEARGFFL